MSNYIFCNGNSTLNNFALEGDSTSTSSFSSVLHIIYSADILRALEMFKCTFSGRICGNKFRLISNNVSRQWNS